jgi:NAD(P)-dependent dehydrogenase (short-subunit alcohol dehydrogenase family)
MNERKVALVTGVSSGIGRSIAILLATRGFRVFGTVRRLADLDSPTSNLEYIQLDVRNEESVKAGVKSVLDRAGGIDVVVNKVSAM